MWSLFLVEVNRPVFGFAVDAHVGDFRKPLCRHLVEMFQRSERAAIQQVRGNVLKRFFHFTFRLGTIRSAGPWLKSVMCSESQKPRVIDGLIAVVTSHHDLHVVVQAGGGHTLQVIESADMFTDRSGKVLRFYKPNILAARVTQDVTEGMHPAPAFVTVQVVSVVAEAEAGR